MTLERHRRPPRCAEQFASRRATVCIFKTTTCVVCKPERVGVAHTILEEYTVRVTSASQCMQEKPSFGTELASDQSLCDFLEHSARLVTGMEHAYGEEVWILIPLNAGSKMFGTSLGHPAFVARQLELVRDHQQTLLDRIPLIQDVQSACALLMHRAAARTKCSTKAVFSGVFGRLARLRLHPTMRRPGRA